MTQLKSDSPIMKRQIVNLQIIDDDVAPAAGIVTSKLADGYLFIKADGTVDFFADESHGGFRIIDLGAPSGDNDAVRLIDLQTAQAGVIPKEVARVSSTLADGDRTLSGLLTIDGVTVSTGDRVLIKDQTNSATNGIYIASSGVWSRSLDADTGEELVSGTSIFIMEGTLNANSYWTQVTTGTLTIDSSLLIWRQSSKVASVIAGAGLIKTGNTVDAVGTTNRILVNADNIDISPNYVGQSSIVTLGTITTGHWHGDAIENAYLANSTITHTLGTTGTDISLSPASGNTTALGGTLTINIPSSSAINRGALTAADWIIFNAKQSALGFTALPNTLNNGYIFVGNLSNIATGVPVSSELSITNAGVATISNSAVINKVLTGYVAGSGTVTSSDTILTALQKMGTSNHGAVTLKTGSKPYIELVAQELNATAIDLGASYITGTIGSTVLGNSYLHIGTTQIALNRASAVQSLTGITSIDGSASKWTTTRLIGGNSVDGSANVAFANKFIVQGTTDSGLTNAQFLGALSTGLVKNTTSTGVLSIVTDNSSNWNTAYNDRVVSASFDNDTGNLTIVQQDSGTIIANLDWRYMLKEGRLLNDQWFESYDYAGNICNVFKVSKDNLIEFGESVGVQSLFTVADAGKVTLAEMPIVYSSAGLEMSYCISIDGGGQFKIIGITDGAGGLSSDYVLVDTELHISSIIHASPYTEDKILVGALGIVKYVSGSELISNLGLDTRYLIFKTIALSVDSGFTWGSSSVVADLYNDALTLVAGTNISISTDAANDAVKISNTYSYTHPSKTWADKSDLTGASIISNLTIDSLGHPTGWTTRSLALSDMGYSGDSQADHYQYWTVSGDTGTENIGIMGSVTFVGGDAIATVYAPSTNTLTINHDDTSTAANLTASGRTYVTGLTFDAYGHTTGYTTGAETTSWVANSLNVAGYVAAPGAVANKVWKTDGSGNPSWRDDADTLYYPGSFLSGTTTLNLNVSGSVNAGQIPYFSSTQLNTDNTFYFSGTTEYVPNIIASSQIQSSTLKVTSSAASGRILVSNSLGVGTWTDLTASMVPTGRTFTLTQGTGITVSNSGIAQDLSANRSWTITNTGVTSVNGSSGSVTITDTDTWNANSKYVAGYVAAPGAVSNKVWKTDTLGNPSWRDDTDTDTNYYPTGMSFATGSGVLTMSGNGMSNVTVNLDNRYSLTHTHPYLLLTGGTLTGALGGTSAVFSSTLSASEVTATSDRRRKFDIHDIELKPISARYVSHRLIDCPDQLRYGIIAQELLENNPELVRGNYADGYTVNYIDLLVKEVAYLKDELKKLKLLVNAN